jgi:hypothetical protein
MMLVTAKALLVAVLVYSRSICDEFQVSQKTVQALLCPLTCPVAVSSFLAMMAISRWPILASVVDHKGNTTFLVSCYDPVEKHPIFVNTINQVMSVLCQNACNTVLGNMTCSGYRTEFCGKHHG